MPERVARYYGYDSLARASEPAALRWSAVPALLIWSAISGLLWAVILTIVTSVE